MMEGLLRAQARTWTRSADGSQPAPRVAFRRPRSTLESSPARNTTNKSSFDNADIQCAAHALGWRNKTLSSLPSQLREPPASGRGKDLIGAGRGGWGSHQRRRAPSSARGELPRHPGWPLLGVRHHASDGYSSRSPGSGFPVFRKST